MTIRVTDVESAEVVYSRVVEVRERYSVAEPEEGDRFEPGQRLEPLPRESAESAESAR
jgi:hypothetical protein